MARIKRSPKARRMKRSRGVRFDSAARAAAIGAGIDIASLTRRRTVVRDALESGPSPRSNQDAQIRSEALRLITSRRPLWDTFITATAFALNSGLRPSGVLARLARDDPKTRDAVARHLSFQGVAGETVTSSAAQMLTNLLAPVALNLAAVSTPCLQDCLDRYPRDPIR